MGTRCDMFTVRRCLVCGGDVVRTIVRRRYVFTLCTVGGQSGAWCGVHGAGGA